MIYLILRFLRLSHTATIQSVLLSSKYETFSSSIYWGKCTMFCSVHLLKMLIDKLRKFSSVTRKKHPHISNQNQDFRSPNLKKSILYYLLVLAFMHFRDVENTLNRNKTIKSQFVTKNENKMIQVGRNWVRWIINLLSQDLSFYKTSTYHFSHIHQS